MQLSKQKSYRKSYDLAVQEIKKIPIDLQAEKGGLPLYAADKGKSYIKFSHFERNIKIYFPDVRFEADDGLPISLISRILILHYLIKATGKPVVGQLIDFRQIPGGLSYYPVFERRAKLFLISNMGNDLDILKQAALLMGGIPREQGDLSFTLFPFPRVPVTLTLWQGDEDFPSSGKFLFDASITEYLSSEDIVELCKLISVKLISYAKRIKKGDIRKEIN